MLDSNLERSLRLAVDEAEKLAEVAAVGEEVDGAGVECRVLREKGAEKRLKGVCWVTIGVLVDYVKTRVFWYLGTAGLWRPAGRRS